jgi:hypothetical protein
MSNLRALNGIEHAAQEPRKTNSLIGTALRLLTDDAANQNALKTSLGTLARVLDAIDYDLFGDQPTPVYRADPDKVREDLYKILAEARAAQKMPWEPTRVSVYRTIFPQMTNWLPGEEAAQLRFEFETELARLEAA